MVFVELVVLKVKERFCGSLVSEVSANEFRLVVLLVSRCFPGAADQANQVNGVPHSKLANRDRTDLQAVVPHFV